MECRFCGKPAIARFSMERGCMCYPEDREQALCPQHIVSAEPIGAMEVTEVLDAEAWEWFVGTRSR